MDNRNRDPLAITIAVAGLLVQTGMWFYWSGRLEQRVTNVETTVSATASRSALHLEKDSQQDAQIAVTVAQYTEVLRRLNNIETSIERLR